MATAPVLDDLEAEYDELDRVLASLDDAAWDVPTPAEPYAVRDQVFHLAFSEELASMALRDRSAFASRLVDLLDDVATFDERAGREARALSPAALLERWRAARGATVDGLRSTPVDARIPWVVGDMSVGSFATARLMETWAHGQDVLDGLGRTRAPSAGLRHIAHLGVATRRFAYRNRGLEPPDAEVRVELDAPGGGRWTWGPASAADRVAGAAEDFCLVVTQRRHVGDTALVVTGPRAAEWMAIAQAFAGPPTDGRRPGQFARAGA